MLILNKDDPKFEFCDEYFQYLLDNKEGWDEEDVKEFIDGWQIECIPGEEGRWERTINSICELNGKYYSIIWFRGLTEYQENYYGDTEIVEVKPVEKIITVTEWVPVKNE